MANVNVNFRRGGKAFLDKSFTIEELQSSSLSEVLSDTMVAEGMGEFEVFLRNSDSTNEYVVSENNQEASLERILRGASEDDEIIGKTFLIDVSTEHVGACKLTAVA